MSKANPADAFGLVFDSLEAGLIVVGHDRVVVAWNAWIADAAGLSAASAVGRRLDELFPEARLAPVTAAVDAALASGVSRLLTHSLHRTIFPLRTRVGRPLVHDVYIGTIGGPDRQCLIQIFDVTVAAERAELLRQRQNARYDAIVDSAPDVILTLDADDTIRLANPAAARQFGYRDGELIGRPAAILFQDRQAWVETRRAVLDGKPVQQPVEIIACRKDGTLCYLEVSLSRWLNASRIFLTAILRDVGDRKLAEEALRASEAQFRFLAQAMPNHVWTSPPSGKLDWFNERVYEYAGAAHGALDDDGWTAMVHADDLAGTAERWTAAIRTAQPYETEFRLRRADGRYRWHIARAVPVTGARGEILRWVGSNTDIEDQKVATQALADLNAVLEERVTERTGQLLQAEQALLQSQKMEAVGQLTGGIAHDFNNFLQGIIGSLDQMQKHIALNRVDDLDRLLNGALSSANRAAALTHRLLAFSRRHPVDPRSVDVNELIGTVEELLQRSIGETIVMDVKVARDLWLVRCDSNQLENALLNLAINARDAMPDGGRLTVETANRVFDKAEAARRELSAGEFVSILVTDTGVGMPADVKARAFDPFFTTKPIGQGTGLGLSMIYGFARQSGGSVMIDSEIDVGTTVEICLPRYHRPAEEQAAEAEGPKQSRASNDEVVLIVEDEAIVRMLVVDVLSELGYRVLEAADGPTALRIVQSEPRIDLLVTDIGLPGLNGRQLADAARVNRPGLKVLFMTGYAETAASSSFLQPGMAIITKPFVMDTLASRIREMLEAQSAPARAPQ